MKLNKIALAATLGCAATSGFAQTADNAQKQERIEITGSSIKRVQDATALPIQIITRADIEKAGIVSAEQLIATISANGTSADNLSSNVGIQLGSSDRNNNGNSSANLRGLGSSSTLVLLNGRRVSLHGAKGNSVDLNSIPLAAVRRVEVLKDGASAIYGTDAIGGVINFILESNFQGATVTGFVDATQHGGGNIYRGSVTAGTGDLAKDKYNIMGSLTIDRQEILKPDDRRSFVNGFQPERGLSPDTAGTPYATHTGGANTAIGASYRLPATGTQAYTRANLLSFQGKCDSVPGQSQYQFVLWDTASFRNACAFDYGGSAILIQPIDRLNLVTRGRYELSGEHAVIAELVASTTKAVKQFEASQLTTSIAAGNAYPVNGPYYQDLSAFIPTFDKTKPIAYRWRCTICGGRTIETETRAHRLLVGMEGVLGAYDYKVGLSTAGSGADSTLGRGYMRNTDKNGVPGLNSVLGSGILNPWLLPGQTQTAAGLAALDGARADGTKLFGGRAKLSQLDGSISGELMKLPAGPLAFAAGVDMRSESYQFSNAAVTTEVIRDAPFDPEFAKVSRTIKAVYGELAIPITKTLETSLAIRHDKYSDFGGTTNPKISFKFSPIKELAFRGSANTGFRAPSFFQLYGATSESPVPGNVADPILCPQRPGDVTVCAIRPLARFGGNKDLQPETAKQLTLGFVVAPTDWMTASIDMWRIARRDRIYELTPQQVLANYTTFPTNLVRGTNGLLDGPGGYIRAGFVNADGDILRGTELSLAFNGKVAGGKWTAKLDGTYIDEFKSRVFVTDKYVDTVGKWNSRDLYVRWKHGASVSYETGPWSVTVSQQYTSGYKDEVPFTPPPGFSPDVSAYTTYGASVSYTGIKNATLRLGVKNLFDTKPPFTAHNVDFASGAGWDPRVGDPRLRAFTFGATYKF